MDLFAPFPSETIPLRTERARLTDLLHSPFATTVPVSPQAHARLDVACPGLFSVDSTRSAPLLEWRLGTALFALLRPDAPTELQMTSFWDMVGFELPDWVGKTLGLPIRMRRYSQLAPATFLGWQIWGHVCSELLTPWFW